MIECTFEHDDKKNLRHVTVSVIAVNLKSEVLILRYAEGHPYAGKYTIPSNFLNRDEETSLSAMKLLERTGYFGRIHLLFQINDSPDQHKNDLQNVDFVYVLNVIGGQSQVYEGVESISWLPFDKLPKDEEFAYDHRKSIELYFQYQNSEFPLPILGKI